MSPSDIDDSRRRKILKSLGASAAIAGLAGCNSGGDGDTTTTPADTTTTGGDDTTTTGGGTTDETTDETTAQGEPMKTAYYTQGPLPVPKNIQFNPFNFRNLVRLSVVNDQFAQKITTENRWEPQLAESWEFGGGKATIHINPDYVWTNGDAVTAQDAKTFLEIQEHVINVQGGERNWIGDWNVVDDHTIEYFKKRADTNDTLFKQAVLPTQININRNVWGDTLDALNQAQGTDNYEEVLRERVLNYSQGPDELVTNGPWQLDSINGAQSISFIPFEDNPRSDNITEDINTYYLPYTSGREEAFAGLRNGDIDGTLNTAVPETVIEQMPDYTTPVVTSNNYGGGSTWFQFDDEWFSRRGVRKAIAYATNWTAIANNAGRSATTGNWTGVYNIPMRLNWMGQEMLDNIENYKWSGRDPAISKDEAMQRASDYMRQAGLEMGSNWWIKPNGEPLNAPVKTIAGWQTSVVFVQSTVDFMREFNIKATSNPIESSTYWNQVWRNGDFRMAIAPALGGGPHPYYVYNNLYDQDDPTAIAKRNIGMPTEVEVPMPIGDREGAMETFNPDEMVDELRVTSDLEAQREIVQNLGWITNQLFTQKPNNATESWPWYSTDVWELPEPVEDYRNPPDIYNNFAHRGLIERGLIQPKYQ